MKNLLLFTFFMLSFCMPVVKQSKSLDDRLLPIVYDLIDGVFYENNKI